ncbi:O-antigen ligase family protein [Mesorhizobium sp. SP-1A]|uniref:O-antigen ligase family protein n=1 Tax=Mesorhizobium sp. SP-1A TaxID=3077840 RepID=UPI0028F74DD3|nr:O-antigen ligase family protein [Mesorhizobium sp. SP-1A]
MPESQIISSTTVMPGNIAPGGSHATAVAGPARGRRGPRMSDRLRTQAKAARHHLAWPVVLFLVALFNPWTFKIGSLAMSMYRLVLVATIVPCLIYWLRGKVGFRLADILLLAYCGWGTLALDVNHGIGTATQSGGILFVETMGAYLLARCYVRKLDDFRNMARLLFWLIAALLPFALYEAVFNDNILLRLFSSVLPSHPVSYTEPRWGLRRVQTVFEHPILFGVICGSALAAANMVVGYGETGAKRLFKTGIVGATTFLSFSAGPISAIAAQGLLLGWDWVLRNNPNRWKLLWTVVFAMYVLVSLASNQSVPEFYMTHFSFDPESAGYRALIWQYGSGSVMNHPLFGVGYGKWDRPDWMTSSIDMFWLANAIFYGLPGGLAMFLAYLSTVFGVGAAKGLGRKAVVYRTAFLIMMTGFFMVGWTVHFWNATYVLFLFLLGSGAFLAEPAASGDEEPAEEPKRRRNPRTHGHRPVKSGTVPQRR